MPFSSVLLKSIKAAKAVVDACYGIWREEGKGTHCHFILHPFSFVVYVVWISLAQEFSHLFRSLSLHYNIGLLHAAGQVCMANPIHWHSYSVPVHAAPPNDGATSAGSPRSVLERLARACFAKGTRDLAAHAWGLWRAAPHLQVCVRVVVVLVI
jgi:hypothetical protein